MAVVFGILFFSERTEKTTEGQYIKSFPTINTFPNISRVVVLALGSGWEQNRINRQTYLEPILSQMSRTDNYIVWGRVIVFEFSVTRTDRFSLMGSLTCNSHGPLDEFSINIGYSINYLFLLQPKQHF